MRIAESSQKQDSVLYLVDYEGKGGTKIEQDNLRPQY